MAEAVWCGAVLQAGDLFHTENSTSESNKCNLKVRGRRPSLFTCFLFFSSLLLLHVSVCPTGKNSLGFFPASALYSSDEGRGGEGEKGRGALTGAAAVPRSKGGASFAARAGCTGGCVQLCRAESGHAVLCCAALRYATIRRSPSPAQSCRCILHLTAAELRYAKSSHAALRCAAQIAQFSAELERYPKAIELYEEVAKASVDNNLLKYRCVFLWVEYGAEQRPK